MNKWINYKKQSIALIKDAAVVLRRCVSLDTLKSSCQNSPTKLFVISGNEENVEKYQTVQKFLKWFFLGGKTKKLDVFFRLIVVLLM